MKYLIAFLASLAILAATPVFAADEGCVTTEKFVSQNAEKAKIEWFKELTPAQIPLILDILKVPEERHAEITRVKLFSVYTKRQPEGEAGIAFGHDDLVCVWAILTPAAVAVVLHILQVTEAPSTGEKI